MARGSRCYQGDEIPATFAIRSSNEQVREVVRENISPNLTKY